MRVRSWFTVIAVAVCMLSAPACIGGAKLHTAPATASLQAQQAFRNTQILKGLDLLRDAAIDANAESNTLLSDATTKRVVQFHESAILLIRASTSGWVTTLTTGLDELLKNVPANEAKLLAPYFTFAKQLLKGL